MNPAEFKARLRAGVGGLHLGRHVDNGRCAPPQILPPSDLAMTTRHLLRCFSARASHPGQLTKESHNNRVLPEFEKRGSGGHDPLSWRPEAPQP
jgi:hypothetical protein